MIDLLFISGTEVIVILLVALLLFGAKGFPSFARQLGKGIQQVRNASGELQKDIRGSAERIQEEIDEADPRRKSRKKEGSDEEGGKKS